jgi:hypothetical protein
MQPTSRLHPSFTLLGDTPMHCAICGDQIDVAHALVLPTTDGQHVHLMCAEREAHAAARRRTIRAMVIAMLCVGLLVTAILLRLGWYWIVILALLLASIHVGVNHRWWYYNIQSVRRWLRLRG